MHLHRWLGIRLRSDWIRKPDPLRLILKLQSPPPPGWYMLSIRYQGEQLRCYGLFHGAQGRILVSDRLRRRLVRIPAGARDVSFEIRGLNGEGQLPLLRLVPQTPWRVRNLLRRKLLRMHPSYDRMSLDRPLPILWRDYNRLQARRNWSLLGYDDWIKRKELPSLILEQKQSASGYSAESLSLQSPSNGQLSVRIAPGIWGEAARSGDYECTLASLAGQMPGCYELLASDEAADLGDANTWLVLAQVGDRLAPQALRRFVEALASHPNAKVLYGDEDRISAQGRRHSPQFKPAWNPDLLYSDPHYSHSWLIRSDLAQQIGRDLAAAGEEVSLYGLVLEATASIPSEQIVHVPAVLYHRADRPGERRGDAESAAVLERFLVRHGHPVSVTPRPGGGHRLHWPLPDPAPLVSIIIPTRDRGDLLRCCLDSLNLSVADNPPTELLIIDNDSSDPASIAYLDELRTRTGVTVLRRPGEFNFAAFNNEAAAIARGDVLAFLNNDVEALQPGWLRNMVAEALRPGVGAVGARLLFDDGCVQHAGVLLGIGGVAGHAHKYLDGEAEGYQLRLRLTHQVSAVTAAALVLRRDLFMEVGGFDAKNFAVNYNDVDLCLRLMQHGYRNLYCADAILLHHESRSRGAPTSPSALAQWHQERQAMQSRWGYLLEADPHYSPHLSLVEENFILAMRNDCVSARVASICASNGMLKK
jgi:GT2 family glycosyltransferase